MANNIAVKITADVADLTAKRAILSSELKAATSDLNSFAKAANENSAGKAVSADMLKAADSVAKTRAQIKLLDGEMKGLGSHGGGQNALFNILDRSRLGVIQEAGAKIPIFGSAVAALGPAGIAAAAGLAAMAFAAEKATKAAEWAEELKRASTTLGLTTTQLQEFDFALNAMGIDVAKGREALSGLEKTIGLVESGLARSMSVKAFTDGLKISPEDLRGWGTLEEQLPHILDAMAKLDPEERAALSQRLKIDPEVMTSMIEARGRMSDLIDEAHRFGVIISADVIAKSSESAGKMREWKAVIDGELRVAFIQLAPAIVGMAQAVAEGAKGFADFLKGVEHVLGPIGQFFTAANDAARGVTGLKVSIGEMLSAMIPGLGPMREFVGLMQQIGAADTASADRLNAIREGINAMTAPAAKPQDLAAPKVAKHKKGGGGASIMSEWEEQLHAQEIASNDFFADNTARELAFWQGKLALTKAGSKEWLDVQSKIYEAQKKLAHDAYDEHLAVLAVQLAADKDNWAKEQADWNAKLAFIKDHYGAESKEYLSAYREFEAAQREHQHVMAQIAKDADKERLDELKGSLATQRTIRQEDARTAESLINERGKAGGAFGDIRAALQVAALHKQLAQQEVADLNATYAAENTLREADVANTARAFGEQSAQYAAAMNAKKAADAAFYNQHAVLENQMVNQEIADQQKIRSAWHSVVDPMVSTTGTQIKGLIEGTETWGQALRNIGEEALNLVIEAIERMIEQWIVNMIVGKAAQSSTAVAQVASYAGVAGAAGVASMAGAPFPLDLGAPAFGASMSAAALGFAGLASLAVGTNVVPTDMLAQIHAGERIIPAADNAALIAAVAGGAGANGVRGGDFHGNFGVTVNAGHGGLDGRQIVRALESSQGHFAKLLKGMHRGGHFNFARG
ncbi:MAG TPA: hypothetical protein VGH15_05885 [Caulobacteraceae bacterium]|jgi:hypothetical protein